MVGEKKMTYVTWKEDQVRKVGLSPLISLIRNTWKKLTKTYYGGEGLICFCLMWFLSRPLGEGQLKKEFSSSFYSVPWK